MPYDDKRMTRNYLGEDPTAAPASGAMNMLSAVSNPAPARQTPQAWSQPTQTPKYQGFGNFLDGFQRGFDPAGRERRIAGEKQDAQTRQQATLALLKQQRAMPEPQRAAWFEQNRQAIAEATGQNILGMPADPNDFTDQALDGHIAMLAGQLGKPETMTPYQQAQLDLEERKLAQGPQSRPITVSRGQSVFDPETGKMLYEAPAEPETMTPYQREMLDLRRAEMQAKAGSQFGAAPVNPAQARAAIANKQKIEQQAEAARQNARSSLSQLDSTKGLLDTFKNHPGLEAVYGLGVVDPWFKNIGGEGANAKSILDQLAGKAFLDSVQSLRGLGQLSDAEGKRLTQAAIRLANEKMDDKEAKAAITEYETALGRMKQAIERDLAANEAMYSAQISEWDTFLGGGQAGAPAGGGLTPDEQAELEALEREFGQ